MYNNSLFWFRQDLRTFDNNWLIKAIKSSKNLLTLFIFDKNIVNNFWWLSDKKFLFLKESLLKLDLELKELWWKLLVYYDYPENIIPFLVDKYNIDAIFTNKSYSNYWKKRDENIGNLCETKNIDFFSEKDYLMLEPEEIEQRKVFTPFYKIWCKKINNFELNIPNKYNWINPEFDINIFLDSLINWDKHPYFTINFWEQRLEKFDFKNYDIFRNDLDKDWTSKLWVYLRFWIYSVREIYKKAFSLSESFVRELAWRDFWQHIDYYFPFTKKLEFQEKRRNIKWKYDEDLFEKWCKWETWYPIVDASIKQLLETNWMHWRSRMVVASFLTKDLLIDWRLWEAFFKKHLLDYDENVNFWNWQWSASVWADPKPLRIFNPCLQSEKFDKQAKFIKKYLPILEKEELKKIHNPIENKLDYNEIIVNHNEAQKLAREEYKKW